MRAGRLSAILAFAAVAASWPALLAPPASALEPGVHVDPGSPAAKEYALPVNKARGTGKAGGSEGGSEEAHEQLFGAGIKPPSSGSPGGSRSATPRAPRNASRVGGRASPGARKGSAGAQAAPALVRRVANGRSSGGGGSSALVLLGGGVAVIVLGALAGIVLRHGRRPTSPAEGTRARDEPRRA
jgi:hypothetical protein